MPTHTNMTITAESAELARRAITSESLAKNAREKRLPFAHL
jgi:hypothetical protein